MVEATITQVNNDVVGVIVLCTKKALNALLSVCRTAGVAITVLSSTNSVMAQQVAWPDNLASSNIVAGTPVVIPTSWIWNENIVKSYVPEQQEPLFFINTTEGVRWFMAEELNPIFSSKNPPLTLDALQYFLLLNKEDAKLVLDSDPSWVIDSATDTPLTKYSQLNATGAKKLPPIYAKAIQQVALSLQLSKSLTELLGRPVGPSDLDKIPQDDMQRIIIAGHAKAVLRFQRWEAAMIAMMQAESEANRVLAIKNNADAQAMTAQGNAMTAQGNAVKDMADKQIASLRMLAEVLKKLWA